MLQRPVVGFEELDAQSVELLPSREMLFFDINVAPMVGVNTALALNAASIGTSASGFAGQALFAFQQ